MANYSRIYANALAKYNEGRLAGRELLARLTDAEFTDAVKILCDFGYGDGAVDETSYDVDAFITAETNRLIEFVEDNSVSTGLTDCLLDRFIFSNAKIFYKARFTGGDKKASVYKINSDYDLEKAAQSGDYSALPEAIASAYEALDEAFRDKRPSPKEIDAVLTKAMYNHMLLGAKSSRNKNLLNYVKSEIDLKNILTMLRMKNLGLGSDDAAGEIIEGGTLDTGDLLLTSRADQATVAFIYRDTNYGEAVEKLADSDLVSFEAGIDEYLYLHTLRHDEDMTTLDPFIGYFNAKLLEFKIVKTVLVCLKNGVKGEIDKRLRRIYD